MDAQPELRAITWELLARLSFGKRREDEIRRAM